MVTSVERTFLIAKRRVRQSLRDEVRHPRATSEIRFAYFAPPSRQHVHRRTSSCNTIAPAVATFSELAIPNIGIAIA